MLVTGREILEKADRGGYAVGAFNVSNLETIQAVLEAAMKLKSPVIIQTTESAIAYAGMEALGGAVHGIIKDRRYSSVPVVLHFDHGRNLDLISAAIESGWYTSVMFDGSHLSFSENVQKTKKVVALAHAKGISVEAELGVIRGKEDVVRARASQYTDPTLAAEFVQKTDCDSLGVSIGTAHGPIKFKGKPKLEFSRLAVIDKVVSIPLVLHGASGLEIKTIKKLHASCATLGDCLRAHGAIGVPDAAIKRAIKLGIRKINIDTDLRIAFTAAVRDVLLSRHEVYDPRDLLRPARELMTQVVVHKIKLFCSQNKA